jgi:hypothetical protein
MRRFRARYGAAPLHLIAVTASFVIVAAAVVNWLHLRTHIGNILLWYLGCLLLADFLLIPLAAVLDRIASGRTARRTAEAGRRTGWAYVRVPAMLSGLMLLVFLPLIAGLGDSTFQGTVGVAPSDRYLVRWLVASGVMFASSGLLYALRRAADKRPSRRAVATRRAADRADR